MTRGILAALMYLNAQFNSVAAHNAGQPTSIPLGHRSVVLHWLSLVIKLPSEQRARE